MMSTRFGKILPLVLLTVIFTVIPQTNTEPLTGAIARPNPRPRPNPREYTHTHICIYIYIYKINSGFTHQALVFKMLSFFRA